jgi:hypothetical protein
VEEFSSSSIHSRLRLCLTLTIALVVISSSPVIVFDNLGLARPSPSSSQSNTPTAPSTISQDGGGDVSIQAPLQIPRTLQSTDLVNSLAFYEVTFITSTTGAIDKIRMDFPAGTGIGAAGIIERVGIGGGTLLKSGSSITYDVTFPVSIPSGTFIRLEMFGIKNPISPSTAFTATITTRDSAGTLIDGPSQTNVYTIKKIVSSDIADGAITSPKIATSFAYQKNLADGVNGWTPGGSDTDFAILDPLLVTGFERIIINLERPDGVGFIGPVCGETDIEPGTMTITCSDPPADGTILNYAVIIPAALPP